MSRDRQFEDGLQMRKQVMGAAFVDKAFAGVDELEVGMQFQAQTAHGTIPVVITEIDGDEVTVDGNHPLAGEALHFDIEIVDVREASVEEVLHGHVHGAGGHHH